MQPLTLTDVSEAYHRLLVLDESDSESNLQPFLDSIKTQAKDKILAIANVVEELEAQVAIISGEIGRLEKRINARAQRQQWLTSYLLRNMEALGLRRVESPTRAVWLHPNPPSVQVLDEAQVPAEFIRATLRSLLSEVPEAMIPAIRTREVEKSAILALHKEGKPLPPGVQVVEGKHHLRIK